MESSTELLKERLSIIFRNFNNSIYGDFCRFYYIYLYLVGVFQMANASRLCIECEPRRIVFHCGLEYDKEIGPVEM